MMRMKYTSKFEKLRTLVIAVAILLVTLAAFMFAPSARVAPVAETAGTVTLHVFDPQSKYSEIGGWFWVKGAGGKEYKVSTSAAADEPFSKTYTENGSSVTNKARTFTVQMSAAQITQLKSGTPLGFLICKSTGGSGADFWARYEKETSDVFADLSQSFDADNNAHIYYVRKDNVAYTDIEEAKMALEKITGARFTAKTASGVTVAFEASSPLAKNTIAKLSVNGETEVSARISVNSSNSFVATVTFTQITTANFDFTADYYLTVGKIPTGATVSKTALIDDTEFVNTYENAETQGLEYGAVYTGASTTLRVWAPFASAITAKIYDKGVGGNMLESLGMEKRLSSAGKWGGVWEVTLEGDYNGKYYTYLINNYGAETETIDPYAKACGANGSRGMIVDLDSTDPAGWANDRHLYAKNATAADTPIVWEVAVKDFSSSPDSGMKYKGKYLAFTEQNTTVPGQPQLKTGINYLKDLGITYVHLNPVYDFATIDETELTKADNTKDSFNWGYDPQNYNIPEGSFSTDPYNGAVRIREFKQMVKALHDAGIGVIMDVVYNHTYSTSGQALHDTVPYYYHRTDANGAFTDASGCGNETASERTMMRKYIVDSILYWANEYHIDGFRFDLMGIHDITTIAAIRSELDKIDGGNGAKLLMYGEPWSADGTYVPASYTKRVNATRTGVSGLAINPSTNKMIKICFAGDNYARNMTELPDRVAVFNDTGREGLRGNNDPGNGWANGNPGGVSGVLKLLEGGAGGSGSGMNTGAGSRNVAYAAAHDNYTLWDQIRGARHGEQSALFYDDPVVDDIKRCKLVASVYLTSSGISFMLAGEEMGRTKYGNENSYNSPSKLNQIVWARQKDFASLHTFYKNLIKLRRDNSAALFSYSKSTAASYCWGSFGDNVTDYSTGYFKFTRTQGGKTLTVELNPTTLGGSVSVGTTRYTI